MTQYTMQSPRLLAILIKVVPGLLHLGRVFLFAGLFLINPISGEEIKPTARKEILVLCPKEEDIVVPEKDRGVRNVHDKEGQPRVADFTSEYRQGFSYGWQDFLDKFQLGKFDLDETVVKERFPDDFLTPNQSAGPSSFYDGQVAGMKACRDALLALINNRGLSLLPARPSWLKKLLALGACEPTLNNTGNPTSIWWNYSSKGEKVTDNDLKLLREIPTSDVESLGLDHVDVTDTGVQTIPSMPKLTEINITARRSLTGACLHGLDRFPRLRNLTLVGLRSVNADDLVAFEKLKELEFLDLTASEIKDDAVPILIELPKLSILLLDWAYDGSDGPRMSSGAIARLGECRNIECLQLSGCAVDDAALSALATHLRGLTRLSLAKTKVTDASIGSIQHLENLEWLNLANTGVTDAGIVALAKHASIKTLSLQKTKIGDATLPILATLPMLNEVRINRGQFSDIGMAAFKRLKPKVRIEFTD
jgi:Leucine Rich repeat